MDRPHPTEPEATVEANDDSTDDAAEVWAAHRRRLLDLAYRLLGSISDAEDVVQDAYGRLQAADRSAIDDVTGWIVAVTSRLCVDHLRRHEQSRRAYVGPWLPEPVVGRAAGAGIDEVADRITLDDSVRMALLVVLDRLSAAERTAFVLHDVFAVPFDEVGAIVGRSAPACRQLASRARRKVAASGAGRGVGVDPAELDTVARRFARACEAGDLAALVDVLASDVVGDFDSAGLVPGAPLTELDGAEVVAAQLVASVSGRGATIEVADVNGEPGVLVTLDGWVVAVIALGVYDGCVDRIHAVGNPAKLTHLRRPRDDG
ncbi:MAG: RNA polymerase sigma factor SigJ [Actinomycetota bacterium]|nr:RNA polymerase sigma factor SigJ [Actinomycetota bacterium]